MPAAIAIPAIIGAAGVGASVYGAHKAAGAANDAARLQVASSDRAQQFNERAYADQQRAMNPYMQLGTDAMARYQQKYGGGAPAPRPAPMGAPPMGVPQGQPQGMSPFGGRPPMPQGPQGPPMVAPPQGQPGEPMVLMVSPDGEQRPVPQSKVPDALARGAKQVQ